MWNCDHKSVNQIAKILIKNKSTISREIKRNSNSGGSYQFNFTQEKSKSKQLHKFFFKVEKYNDFVNLFNKYFDKRIHGVKATWCKIKVMNLNIAMPSWRQVFNWVKNGQWRIWPSDRLELDIKKAKKEVGVYFLNLLANM
ncbi:helix-turn-helix domain-containing protein [Candidatus Mycoplasma pogonae]